MPLHTAPAAPSDYEAFARLFPELGVPESTPSRDRFEATIAPDALFVRDGDSVVGYGWARVRGHRLHVVHVITDPAHRRRGVARHLMGAFADRGRRSGLARWMLNVKPENVGARSLYEQCGMRVAFESASMAFRLSDAERLPAAQGVAARVIEVDADTRFEDASPLSRGELQSFRALGRTIVGAETADGPVGVTAFDPSFPGAAPFHVARPEIARALFEAIRPHAVRDELFVFVEDDPALERVLVAAGGDPRMRVLRMEGTIPPVL